jgi:ribosome-associated protein
MMMLNITDKISIPESEITVEFVRSSGPGGQNVNKVETTVQLRFDILHSPSLPEEVKKRLTALAGRRVTSDGILMVTARRFRHQARNREDALERFIHLVQRAALPPKERRKTRPTKASKERRLLEKGRTSRIKSLRRPPPEGRE